MWMSELAFPSGFQSLLTLEGIVLFAFYATKHFGAIFKFRCLVRGRCGLILVQKPVEVAEGVLQVEVVAETTPTAPVTVGLAMAAHRSATNVDSRVISQAIAQIGSATLSPTLLARL
jgi:hypothetical protein